MRVAVSSPGTRWNLPQRNRSDHVPTWEKAKKEMLLDSIFANEKKRRDRLSIWFKVVIPE